MKAKITFLLVLNSLFYQLYAQVYLDKLYKPTTKENAVFVQDAKKSKDRYLKTITQVEYNSVVSVESYKDKELTIKDGLCKYYNTNSQNLSKQEEYKENKLDGLQIIYYKAPNPDIAAMKTSYKNGVLNGVSEEFFNDGKIQGRRNYQNGFLHGEVKSWRQNGNMYKEMTYVNGRLEGEHKEYHENGNLAIFYNFKDGAFEGKSFGYYPNGKLSVSKTYKNGRECDTTISYFENSKIKSIKIYSASQKSYLKTWFENGNLEMEGQFINGLRDSTWITYSENGEKIKVENYKNNYLNGYYWFKQPDGYVVANQVNDRTRGEYNAYYKNGKPKIKCFVDEYGTNGLYTSWHSNGKVFEKGNMKNDIRVGKWEIYDQNGKLTIVDNGTDNSKFEEVKEEYAIPSY